MCCSVLQCVAVCCSVLQYVAVCGPPRQVCRIYTYFQQELASTLPFLKCQWHILESVTYMWVRDIYMSSWHIHELIGGLLSGSLSLSLCLFLSLSISLYQFQQGSASVSAPISSMNSIWVRGFVTCIWVRIWVRLILHLSQFLCPSLSPSLSLSLPLSFSSSSHIHIPTNVDFNFPSLTTVNPIWVRDIHISSWHIYESLAPLSPSIPTGVGLNIGVLH